MRQLLQRYSMQQMMLRQVFVKGLAMTESELACADISFSLQNARRIALSRFSSPTLATPSVEDRAMLQWQLLRQDFGMTSEF